MRPLPKVITVKEAAARYNVGHMTIRRRAKDGEFKSYRPGTEILIDVESADKWWFSTSKRV